MDTPLHLVVIMSRNSFLGKEVLRDGTTKRLLGRRMALTVKGILYLLQLHQHLVLGRVLYFLVLSP